MKTKELISVFEQKNERAKLGSLHDERYVQVVQQFGNLSREFEDSFSESNSGLTERNILNSALNLLKLAIRHNQVYVDSDFNISIFGDDMIKGFHGRPEAPCVTFGRNYKNQEQIVICGVLDASSKHDWLLSPGVIGIRISKSGEVTVERSPKVKIEKSDSDILTTVEEELRNANARSYIYFKK